MRILNSTVVRMNDGLFDFLIFLMIVLIVLLITASVIAIADRNRKQTLAFTALYIAVIFCIIGMFISWPTTTRYEVCFEEDVPFTEISEQYDIISQHGELYVLEKKNCDMEATQE